MCLGPDRMIDGRTDGRTGKFFPTPPIFFRERRIRGGKPREKEQQPDSGEADADVSSPLGARGEGVGAECPSPDAVDYVDGAKGTCHTTCMSAPRITSKFSRGVGGDLHTSPARDRCKLTVLHGTPGTGKLILADRRKWAAKIQCSRPIVLMIASSDISFPPSLKMIR